ncbi:MAG TPA: cyclic nucleotide-binding domain-containing protein [Candidatus Limnocylindrales bacterium]|nr:cyclic nucleotide-binding domain-containing protein [Candidatus Limnocylindrales bacterium]
MTLTAESKANALSSVPLFAGISPESLQKLADVTGEATFEPGQFIVIQGQVGTGLYVIVEGSAKVARGSDELAVLGAGEFFGELSVIDQQPRYASVQALEPTRCLALASWDLLDLIEKDPQLAQNLLRGMAQRIRAAGDQHRH